MAEFQTRCNEYETDLEVSKNRWGTLSLKSMKKINEKAQTANFTDFTMERRELCAENAKKNTKSRETKTQITQNSKFV